MRRKIELADGIARKEICRVLGITVPHFQWHSVSNVTAHRPKKHGRWLWNGWNPNGGETDVSYRPYPECEGRDRTDD